MPWLPIDATHAIAFKVCPTLKNIFLNDISINPSKVTNQSEPSLAYMRAQTLN